MKKQAIKIRYGGMVFEKEEKQAIERVLKRNWWALDKEGEMFEKELADFLGTKHAIFVNSGSSALLVAFGILARKQDNRKEVIVPATCFPTDVSSIIYNGLKPVIVDVNPHTFLIDEEEVRKNINPRTIAVLAVHTAGNVCNLDELQKICYDYNLYLIEDNCDGFGGKWNGKLIGSQNLSVTSFHAAHIISTGQGGAVFTNSDEEAKIARCLRDWGRMVDYDDEGEGIPPLPPDYQQRYTYTEIGFNLNPIELQAAIGREQLKKIDRFVGIRKKNFEYLKDGLIDLGYKVVSQYDKAQPCWFTIPFLVPKEISRKAVIEKLKRAGIEFRNILASNIVLQPAYRWLYGHFPNANEIARRGLWLPVHPQITKKELDYILEVLKK